MRTRGSQCAEKGRLPPSLCVLYPKGQSMVIAVADTGNVLVLLRNFPYRSASRLCGKLRRTGNFFAFGPDSLRWIPGREGRGCDVSAIILLSSQSGLRLKSISRYPPVSSSKLHPLYPGRSGKTMSGTEKKRMLFYETFFRLGLDSSEVIPPQSFHPEPTAPRIFWRWRCRSSEPKYFLSAPFR